LGTAGIEVIMLLSWQPGRGRTDSWLSRAHESLKTCSGQKKRSLTLFLKCLLLLDLWSQQSNDCSSKSFEVSSNNVDVVWSPALGLFAMVFWAILALREM